MYPSLPIAFIKSTGVSLSAIQILFQVQRSSRSKSGCISEVYHPWFRAIAACHSGSVSAICNICTVSEQSLKVVSQSRSELDWWSEEQMLQECRKLLCY